MAGWDYWPSGHFQLANWSLRVSFGIFPLTFVVFHWRTRTRPGMATSEISLDMNKNGLEIKAVCVGTEKETSTVTDNASTTVA